MKFKIEGMTCVACVEKLTGRLKEIPSVQHVEINLESKIAELKSTGVVDIETIKNQLLDLKKYQVLPVLSLQASVIKNSVSEHKSTSEYKSIFATYKPLIVIFSFILLVSLAVQWAQGFFDMMLFMNHIMAGFFIGLSLFKFLDLKSFAESFSSYDPMAKRWQVYGLIYPFIELGLGLLFVTGKFLVVANIMTILVLSITTVGVIQRLQSKSQFQCACAGTIFKLPLSKVTVAENFMMITMAVAALISAR